MRVNGPDGTPHDFPDDATNDEILKFFGQNSGSAASSKPAAAGSGSSSDQAAAGSQPWTWQRALRDLSYGTAQVAHGFTGGLLDPATAEIQSAISGRPMSEHMQENRAFWNQGTPIPEAGGAMLSPINKLSVAEQGIANLPWLARWVARPFAHALEGGIYSGTKAAVTGDPNITDATVKGSVINALTGTVLSPFSGGVTKPSAPTTTDFKTAATNADQNMTNIKYSAKDAQATANAAQTAAAKAELDPVIHKDAASLLDDFTTKVAGPNPGPKTSSTIPISLRELRAYQDKAKDIATSGTPSAPYAEFMADAIDNHINTINPIKGALSSDDAIAASQQSSDAAHNYNISKALDQQADTVGGVKINRPPNYTETSQLTGSSSPSGFTGQGIADHSWRLAHSIGEPLSMAMGVGEGAAGILPGAGMSIFGAPIMQAGGNWMAAKAVPGMIQDWRRGALGTQGPQMANPNWTQAVQGLALGGSPYDFDQQQPQ
jgi:hypothetical protein